MKPGPPPKDPARRQNRGKLLQLVRAEDGTITPPPFPADVDNRLESAWNTYWASPSARMVREQDVPVVERLFLYRSMHLRCQDEARQVVSVGSQGQEVIAPAARYLLTLEDKILRLETELGLTPLSRAKLAIPDAPPPKPKATDDRPSRPDPRLAALE